MTPAQAIAMLDRQLKAHGQPVTLRRPGAAPVEADVPAFVRAYKPDQLIGDIRQGDTSIVLSPTDLGVFPLPLRQNDKVIINGAERNVQSAEHVEMKGVLVRVNLQVRG